MAKLNVSKTIKEWKGKIPTRYDATYQDIVQVINNSNGIFDLFHLSFVFGYAQGYKARTSELKKGSF